MATDKGLEDVPEGTFEFFSTRFLERASHAPGARCCAGRASGLAPVAAAHPARPAAHTFVDQKEGSWPLTIMCATGQIESNYDETVDSFDEMNLKAELLRGKSSRPTTT